MATCRFCGRDAKLTREHVWSSNLLRRFDREAPKKFDWNRHRVHDVDPTVKDLCQPCSVRMSDADRAIMNFAERYLSGDFNSWKFIPFDDPDLLRWALKTACNMERWLNVPRTW